MTHDYETRLEWTGNTGHGTADYTGYAREYRILIDGKPDLTGSADPKFRGDAAMHNPEDLFVAAISACHMLTYLALCARRGVAVLAYRDSARGTLSLAPGGGGHFDRVILRPDVTLAAGADQEEARGLHAEAHAHCFIARSSAVPIACEPVFRTTDPGLRSAP